MGLWADSVTEHSFYTGTNAFGAKVRVERSVQVFMEIAFGNYLNFARLNRLQRSESRLERSGI